MASFELPETEQGIANAVENTIKQNRAREQPPDIRGLKEENETQKREVMEGVKRFREEAPAITRVADENGPELHRPLLFSVTGSALDAVKLQERFGNPKGYTAQQLKHLRDQREKVQNEVKK